MGVPPREADGVDHHVVLLGALHHVLQRLVVIGELHRRVDAVGEDQNDAAPLLDQQLVDAPVDRVPQRRRPVFLQFRPEDLDQLVAIRRELVGIDLDVLREAADASLVGRQHRLHERFGGPLLELEVGLHAAAAVEQHDQRDRLDVVGEQRERLPLAVVVDGKIFPREIRHQASARAGDGGVDGDGSVGGAELRRLALRLRRSITPADNETMAATRPMVAFHREILGRWRFLC
jgi:hypothetical protein